jgi:hypothetical protein
MVSSSILRSLVWTKDWTTGIQPPGLPGLDSNQSGEKPCHSRSGLVQAAFLRTGNQGDEDGLQIAGAAARAFGFPERRNRDTLADVLEKIEDRIEDRAYLVGDEFTVADLIAASLLSPVMEVDEFSYAPESGFPSSVDELREAYASRPAITWAKTVYGRHRQSLPRISGATFTIAPLSSTDGCHVTHCHISGRKVMTMQQC